MIDASMPGVNGAQPHGIKLSDEEEEHNVSLISARASVAGNFSLRSEHIFRFLQKYTLPQRSFGTETLDSFVPNVVLAFLSSGTKTFRFPAFFLRSKHAALQLSHREGGGGGMCNLASTCSRHRVYVQYHGT